MEENIKQDSIEKPEAAVQGETKQEAPAAAPVKRKSKSNWVTWVALAVVLAVVACFGAKPAYFNYKSGQLISQHYSPWDYEDEYGGGIEGSEDMIDELSELFANVGSGKDIKMTTYRLEKALRMCLDDTEISFFTEDIVWYLSLAYIQQNQFGSARQMLKAILVDPDSPYYDQAEALYKQIESMFFM